MKTQPIQHISNIYNPCTVGYTSSVYWVQGHTDTRTPARVLSYKLTLWAFGSANKSAYPKSKSYDQTQQDEHLP